MKRKSTIAKLPEPHTLDERTKDKALLDLMKKGGRSAPKEEEVSTTIKRLTLRINSDLNDRIKAAAKSRMIPTTAHNWIIEAILEKLTKESF